MKELKTCHSYVIYLPVLAAWNTNLYLEFSQTRIVFLMIDDMFCLLYGCAYIIENIMS